MFLIRTAYSSPLSFATISVPLKNSLSLLLIKSSISLNKTYNSIRIGLTTQLDPIDIYIKDIGYTIVSSSMKSMIEIYRDYKKFIKNGTENDKDSFIKIEMKKNNNLSSEYINRCIDNKKYCFTLFVEENQKMEFVFFSYDECYEKFYKNIRNMNNISNYTIKY